MLQNPRKTLGFKKSMVYKIPPGGGGKPYPASGLQGMLEVYLRCLLRDVDVSRLLNRNHKQTHAYIMSESSPTNRNDHSNSTVIP